MNSEISVVVIPVSEPLEKWLEQHRISVTGFGAMSCGTITMTCKGLVFNWTEGERVYDLIRLLRWDLGLPEFPIKGESPAGHVDMLTDKMRLLESLDAVRESWNEFWQGAI